MPMETVIIIGSSRKNGYTAKLAAQLASLTGWDTVDLNDFQVAPYDYEHRNRHDDFLPLIRRLIQRYDTFVFATPVYWYAMSGTLKIFFDRITDLLDNEKDLGRKLRGKRMAAISSSIGDHLGEQFWFPFIATAGYLGMRYLGHLHTLENDVSEAALKDFSRRVSGLNETSKGR